MIQGRYGLFREITGCAGRCRNVINGTGQSDYEVLAPLEARTDRLLELLDRQGPRLHGLLTRLTLRADVAEDLMQELFIRLSQARRLDRVDNLAAYARTVAVNLANDWRRRRRPLPIVPEHDPTATADQTPSGLHRLIQQEQLQQVLDATTRLTGLQRRVFVLRFLEQWSIEEIAQETGKTAHHVRAIASRALARVRKACARSPRVTESQFALSEDSHVEVQG